jgi:hypothetical protein
MNANQRLAVVVLFGVFIAAHAQPLTEAELKSAVLRCDQDSAQRMLSFVEAMPCFLAWDALLKRSFGGSVDALLAWWQANRP